MAMSHGKLGECGSRAMPMPEIRHPSESSTGKGLRSVTYPNSGWMTEEVRCAASRMVPVAA
jgi:hypothetical protein